MWRRWASNPDPPAISHPTLFETTLEDGYLETIPEVDSICSRSTSFNNHSYHEPSNHTALPRRSVSGTESTYSQPSPPSSPPYPLGLMARNASLSRHTDISPVSTPRGSVSEADLPPVSPIEPTVSASVRVPLAERSQQSFIPRRVVNDSQYDETSNIPVKGQTKWDEYSGEPTTNGNGKPSSYRTGEREPLEMQYPQLKERTKQILAGLRERDAARKVPWGRQPPPVAAADPLEEPPQRVPWKGPSGRTTLVEPVKNTTIPRKTPNQIPQRNISRMNASQNTLVLAVENAQARPVEHVAETDCTPSTLRTVPSEESLEPIAPLRVPATSRKPVPDLPLMTSSLNTPFQSPHSAPPTHGGMFAYSSVTRAESPQYDEPEPKTPTTPTPIGGDYGDHHKPIDSSTKLPKEVSRFSWTTYTTSVAGSPGSALPGGRDSSPLPPMPNFPAALEIRKRPISTNPYMSSNTSAADSTASLPVRKPLPGQRQGGGQAVVHPRVTSKASIMSTSKDLPPVPTEFEAAGKIPTLEAQMEGMARRKYNINRIISDLEDRLRRNAIIYDMWKRREVEASIARHKTELDEVLQEIHDMGLILHRAQKKRDKDANYEQPTGLWIKRVTS